MSNPEKQVAITIKCSEKQARIIIKALDLFSRLLIGQIHELENFFRWRHVGKLDIEQQEAARIGLLRFKRLYFENMAEHESFGICNPKAPEDARISYEILKRIESKLAWHKKPEGGHTVDFHEPLKVSDEKFIEVKVEEI